MSVRKYPKNVLYLSIKRKYFDEILSGKKKFEYRDYKEFYIKKFGSNNYDFIVLRAGYNDKCPILYAEIVSVRVRPIVDKQTFRKKLVYAIKLDKPQLIIKNPTAEQREWVKKPKNVNKEFRRQGEYKRV